MKSAPKPSPADRLREILDILGQLLRPPAPVPQPVPVRTRPKTPAPER